MILETDLRVGSGLLASLRDHRGTCSWVCPKGEFVLAMSYLIICDKIGIKKVGEYQKRILNSNKMGLGLAQ